MEGAAELLESKSPGNVASMDIHAASHSWGISPDVLFVQYINVMDRNCSEAE